MTFIEKYFSRAKPNETLFRKTSTPSNLDNMLGSFYYYVKVEASEGERQRLKECACSYDAAHGDVDSLLIALREQPKEQAIEKLTCISSD